MMNFTPVSFQTAGPLTIVQINKGENGDTRILSFTEASNKNLIAVKEINEGGNVNLLIVHNRSDFYVFLMDGDILTGAKQNRVLNTSVLLAPKSETKIPVSCVEQGRWRHTSETFSPTEYSAPPQMRHQKHQKVTENLRESMTFDAGQGEVWESVAAFQRASGADSATSNLSDVYQHKKNVLQEEIDKLVPDPGAQGAVFFLGSKVLHADMFASHDLFKEYYKKILRGMSIELDRERKRKKPLEAEKAAEESMAFINSWFASEKENHQGPGVGIEKRVSNEKISGMELEFHDHLVHLSVFNAETMRR